MLRIVAMFSGNPKTQHAPTLREPPREGARDEGLTTTAPAQGRVPTEAGASLPKYRIVTDEARMSRYAAQGYEVKSASHASTFVEYLMQRSR